MQTEGRGGEGRQVNGVNFWREDSIIDSCHLRGQTKFNVVYIQLNGCS